MTTRETAWIYQQEQPTDILIVGRMKREPSVLQNFLHPKILPNHEENEAYCNMTERQKDERNEAQLKAMGL
jgi:hypothetical protein